MHEFFLALGVPLAEGFGMSESTGLGLTNEPGDIGTAMPGTEARLADDGELLLRGPHLMKGYRGDPERTRKVVDDEGWLHTGDVAEVDAEGRYRVVDRRDEMIVSSTGVNMSPVHIESTLKGDARSRRPTRRRSGACTRPGSDLSVSAPRRWPLPAA